MTDLNLKVDGTSFERESLVGDLDFFTIVTSATITSSGAVGDAAQDLFDQYVEVISQKAQPVLLSPVTGGNTFNFAVEHNSLWTESGATDSKAVALKDELEAIPSAGTVTVTFSTTLPTV